MQTDGMGCELPASLRRPRRIGTEDSASGSRCNGESVQTQCSRSRAVPAVLASAPMRRATCTLMLLFAACSARTPSAATDGAGVNDLAAAASAPRVVSDGGVHATREGFIGSAACLECHGKKRAGWQKSWHARALARADRASLV